jgi:hypothetical protein
MLRKSGLCLLSTHTLEPEAQARNMISSGEKIVKVAL